MPETATEHMSAPEGIRTPNLLIRRHRPMVRPGARYESVVRTVVG